jgi:ubiquinone/menaquinone biosynthesis C-methylase UbiE
MNLNDLIHPSFRLVKTEQEIYSVLPEDLRGQHDYDTKAWFYDTLIGNSLYNRVVWKSSLQDYANFANVAANASRDLMLDAGCGTLVFTKAIHQQARRQTILLDRSMGMLRRAQKALRSSCGYSGTTFLLQADVFSLPFLDGCFGTILSMGVLHLFEQPQLLLRCFAQKLKPGGSIYVSSLVAETNLGRRYLNLLHRAGEVGMPCQASQIKALCEKQAGLSMEKFTVIGNMAYMTFRKSTECPESKLC